MPGHLFPDIIIFFFYWLEQLFLQESTVKELLKQREERNNNKQEIYSREEVAETRGWEINGREEEEPDNQQLVTSIRHYKIWKIFVLQDSDPQLQDFAQ